MVVRLKGDKEQTVGYSEEKGEDTWFQRLEGTNDAWEDTGEKWINPWKKAEKKDSCFTRVLFGIMILFTSVALLLYL